MTAAAVGVSVQWADTRLWRCNCPIRPILGVYADTGGLLLRVSGRRPLPAAYLFDLHKQSAVAHCPACHAWRELHVDPTTEQISDRPYAAAFIPRIGCQCERERYPGPADTDAGAAGPGAFG